MPTVWPVNPRMINNKKPVDLVHLDSYTGGSRALNEEILRLFESHCRDILAKLEGSPGDAKLWREATHGLKGAARGVGAFDLAEIVAMAEKTQPGDTAAMLDAIAQIKAKSEAVQLFIEEYLALGG
jgi:HPt (histidine-containing phosphotransfer) domain-containing protein